MIEAFKAQQQQIEANMSMFKTMHGEIEEIKLNVVNNTREIAMIKAENAQLKARADKAEKENAAIKARLDKIEKALNSK